MECESEGWSVRVRGGECESEGWSVRVRGGV